MEATVKAILQKVYAHQIEGVMFHTLASNMYSMLGDYKCMVARHDKQAMSELCNHLKFAGYINKKHREMIVAGATSKPKLLDKEVTERPNSKLERDTIHRKLAQSWLDWEISTEALYSEAIKLMPTCRMLKCLHRDAEREINAIERLMSKMD